MPFVNWAMIQSLLSISANAPSLCFIHKNNQFLSFEKNHENCNKAGFKNATPMQIGHLQLSLQVYTL